MKFNYLLFCIFLAGTITTKSQIVSLSYVDDIKVPVVELAINGQPHRFIIDMGAEVTIINSKYISLPQMGKIKADDANNASKTIFKSKLDALTIGTNKEIAITNATVYSTEINENIFTCNEIAGILGMDLLGKYVVELDPVKKVISFYHESPVKKEEMFPFGKKGNRPSVDVTINDQLINLLLDTGSAGFIRLSDKSGFKFDNSTSQRFSGYSAVGLYGRKEGLINSEVVKGNISIGNRTDSDQVVMIEPTNSSKLGFEYLKHYKLVVSVKDRMLALTKVEDVKLNDMLTKFGFLIGIDNNSYVITRKNVNRTDLEVGDKILEVNGQPVENTCDINKVKNAVENSNKAPVLLIERDEKKLRII